MKHSIRFSNISTLIITSLLWSFFSLIATSSGFGESFQESKAFDKTTQARLAVEHAWETYHHAALGGTLASPMIQTDLEMNLHKSRSLLTETYDAEDQGDMKTVNELIDQIMEITQQVVTESRQPKK
jgi:hypothetical protein